MKPKPRRPRLQPGGMTRVTVAELAQLIRVTEKTVLVWIAAGMPVVQEGRQGGGPKTRVLTLLDLRKALTWYFAESYERLEHERQKTRLAKAQADKQELDAAERRGELVDVGVISQKFADRILNAKAKLRGIAPKLAPQLLNIADAQVISAQIGAEVDAALTELADRAPG